MRQFFITIVTSVGLIAIENAFDLFQEWLLHLVTHSHISNKFVVKAIENQMSKSILPIKEPLNF